MRTSNVSQYQEIQNLEVAVQELESENENLKENMKNQAQNFQNERLKLNEELTTQKQLLVNKESEMVQIRENMLKMNTLLEIKQKDIENLDRRLPEIQRNEVTKQLSQLKKDYDSQLSAEQDKFIGRERILNQQILNYQKELKIANHEIQQKMKTVHLRDIRCVNLEKQIIIEEQKVAKIMQENDRVNRILLDKTEAFNQMMNERQNQLRNP